MPNPEKSRIQRSFVVRASGRSLHVSHNPKSLTLLKVRSTTVHPCLRAENLSSRTLFFFLDRKEDNRRGSTQTKPTVQVGDPPHSYIDDLSPTRHSSQDKPRMNNKISPRSALDIKLETALASREERWIRRRLPDPSISSSRSALIDFNSNDYLSLSDSPTLRSHFLKKLSEAPDVLGSGGSRLLVNGQAHAALEARLAAFFKSEAVLLFNSGFDANVGFFSSIPHPGDAIVYDEYIHASVHDGIRGSRVGDKQFSFAHNSMSDLRRVLTRLRDDYPGYRSGHNSLFLAVESLYSMDGTFAPLLEIVNMLEDLFPLKNGYLMVDEAHSTGIYGSEGRGRVAMLGLEDRVFARLHTFGKALAATGGASLVI